MEVLLKMPDGGRQAAFSEKLEAIGPHQARVFAEQDDRYRDLAVAVEEELKAPAGATDSIALIRKG